jgi:hypothetical protein
MLAQTERGVEVLRGRPHMTKLTISVVVERSAKMKVPAAATVLAPKAVLAAPLPTLPTRTTCRSGAASCPAMRSSSDNWPTRKPPPARRPRSPQPVACRR